MTQKPVLVIHHRLSLSVGGIVRYRIKLQPDQVPNIDSLQFRIRNSSPIYRNITPGSGPWKISVALIRNPDKTPVVPELVPSIGCAQVCRLDAKVIDTYNSDNHSEYEEGSNEWELEVLSEMVLQRNWVDIKVEVYAVLREATATATSGIIDNRTSNSTLPEISGSDVEIIPQILHPSLVSCEYKDTATICGPTFPESKKLDNEEKEEEAAQQQQPSEDGLHLVLLTHGIHGTWLDMLYIKEQIDAHNRHNGKTVTFLTDTNHAGTEEGIQMAGQRVALDILEFTGYCDTEEGQQLRRSISQNILSEAKSSSLSTTATTATTGASLSKSTTTKNRNVFPRGFSKVSIIGHSLGGLINIYALGFIEDVTKGAFFKTIEPVHFITLATPLLGIGFEHPWVLGLALSLGCIGQTGKDLAFEDRSSKRLKRSSSSSSSSLSAPSSSLSSSASASHEQNRANTDVAAKADANPTAADTTTHITSASTTKTNATTTTGTIAAVECELDRDPEPLLLAMARPGSVSNRVLKQFRCRTSYANIENDMAVRFKTSSMMGIPTFDLEQFFSPEGPATQPRKNLYHSALTSTLALLFPHVPTRAKFLSMADAPSPIVVVSHVEAESKPKAGKDDDGKEASSGEVADETTLGKRMETTTTTTRRTTATGIEGKRKGDGDDVKNKKSSTPKKKQKRSSKYSLSSSSSSSSYSSDTDTTKVPTSKSSSSTTTVFTAKSRLDLAHLVAEGYHADMDWTKIGVFIEHEAHVQIVVRRKWYNVDGWKCIQDLVERFDFT